MTREQKIQRARELREQGKTYAAVARELGVGVGTVYRWLNPAHYAEQMEKHYERRKGYAGTCADCGGETYGGDGPGKARERCRDCLNRHQHETRQWTKATVLAGIQRFAERYGRQPVASDFLVGEPSAIKAEQRERYHRDGDYPPYSVIQREFGTWADAIEAAGFPRPRAGHYVRNPRPADLRAAA